MGDLSWFAKLLIGMGFLLVIAGTIIFFLSKIPGFGRLPGDIFINKGNFTFYFPLATSIILSILLTLLLNIFRR